MQVLSSLCSNELVTKNIETARITKQLTELTSLKLEELNAVQCSKVMMLNKLDHKTKVIANYLLEDTSTEQSNHVVSELKTHTEKCPEMITLLGNSTTVKNIDNANSRAATELFGYEIDLDDLTVIEVRKKKLGKQNRLFLLYDLLSGIYNVQNS